MTIAPPALRNELFVGGGFVPAVDGATFETFNPATGELITHVAAGGQADIDSVVGAAQAALDGPWGRMAPEDRSRILHRISTLLIERADELAHLECLDLGKTLAECRAGVIEAAHWFDYFADMPQHLRSAVVPTRQGQFAFTRRQPIGIVGLITPWNFPLPLYGIKVPAALSMGNAVILKPAEQTPLTALALAEIIAEAGMPAGAFNVVTGLGAVTGEALVDHPAVGMISFTGSTEVGRRIAARAGALLKPVALELGGKSPNIVFDDADLDAAVATSLFSFATNQGQLCSAGTRLLVADGIRDEFLEKLVARAESLVVGDPFDPATTLGAVVTPTQLRRIEEYVEAGLAEGARALTGARRPEVAGHSGGTFYTPTIFVDVDPATRIAQEEIFGPVLAVLPFRDEDEAVRLANDVPYGLAAGIWTKDLSRMHRIAERVEAGIVWGNTMHALSPGAPYTGWKQSGLGFEGGPEQAESFTRSKIVWISLDGTSPRYD
ncbi:aldehyde dehydrogenase family protein [Microbacterium sp. MC2]